MLFAYYRVPSSAFGKADRIYPTFIVTRMPHGIAGLLIAAILAAAMSNLSAALNSLSSSSMMDFFLRFRRTSRPELTDAGRLRLARLATVGWALLLFALAVLALHRVGRVVEVGLQIASVAYGAMLGVFLLGVLTRRANQRGAIIGMVFGFGTEIYLAAWSNVPFTWWVTIGTCVTFAVGYVASAAMRGQERPEV
jgi:Na+/proline symporter